MNVLYFMSSLASATRACRPASDKAFMNGTALLGVEARPSLFWRLRQLDDFFLDKENKLTIPRTS